jgi:hypothetical protein
LNLSIFNKQDKKKTWKEIFKIEFADWNRCHYLISDISGIGQQLSNSQGRPQLTFDSTQSNSQLQLQSMPQSDIIQSLTVQDQKFLIEHGPAYVSATNTIQELIRKKVLTTPIPIKLQTMLEKKLLVKNFDECVDAYNNVMTHPASSINGLGITYSSNDIDNILQNEIEQWHTIPKLN